VRPGRLAGLVLVLAGCQAPSGGGGGGAPDPLAEARELLEQGQPDAALARLQGASDPDALFLQGQAWAKKAETAPLPTAPPLPTQLPRGATRPAAPRFKNEEIQAIDCLERAVSGKPELTAARLALVSLLAPHALASHQERQLARRPRRRGAPEPGPRPVGGPDASPERVLREYRLAAQADPSGREAIEGWILFAESLGRLDEADAAYQELLKREREKPEPFLRYGDFLRGSRKDPQAAIAQYSQALIWRPDDERAKARIADVYLGMAADHIAERQYATAEARLKDARRYVSDASSPQGRRLRELQTEVQQVRGRPPAKY